MRCKCICRVVQSINQLLKSNFFFDHNQIDLLNIVLNKDIAEDKKVKLQVATIIGSDDQSPEIIILLSGKVLSIENLNELSKEVSGKMNEYQKTRLFGFFRKINIESEEVEDSLVI